MLVLLLARSVGVQQVGETCRGRVGLHVTEGESWGTGDDGGLGYMYGSTRRACGGRLMAVRAVCADAGEDMPEQAQKETQCASAAWLPSGALESWRRIKKCGPLNACVMTCGEERAAGAGSCWSET